MLKQKFKEYISRPSDQKKCSRSNMKDHEKSYQIPGNKLSVTKQSKR